MSDTTQKKFSFEIKPLGYRTQTIDAGNDFSDHLIVAGRARRGSQWVDRDLTFWKQPYLTGRYEFASGMYMISINQAGKHIQCWLSEVMTSNENNRSRRLVRLAGDLQENNEFTLYENYKPENRKGRISIKGDAVEIRIDDSSMIGYGTDQLVPLDSNPTWSEHMIDALAGGDPAVLRDQRYPLSRKQIQRLTVMLAPDTMKTYIAAFLNVDDSNGEAGTLDRQQKAIELDNYIRLVFFTSTLAYKGKTISGFHKEDIGLAELYGFLIVSQNRLIFDRSVLGWMQFIVDAVEHARFDHENPTLTPYIEKHFGIRRFKDKDENAEPLYYVLSIEAGGVSVELPLLTLGGFVGNIHIEGWRNKAEYEKYKDSEDLDRKALSQLFENYPIVIADVNGGLSWKGGLSAGKRVQGVAYSHAEYSKADILGPVTIADAGFNVGPANYSKTSLILKGSDRLPELVFDCDGFGWQPTASVGAGHTMSTGFILENKSKVQIVKDPFSTIQIADYTAELSLETTVYFALGDSYVTEIARQFLRMVCASELSLLLNNESHLTIVGHADRLDTFRNNLDLSEYRAQNVQTAIEKIMGDHFRIPDKNIHTKGLGEYEAVVAGDKDHTPDPNYRKVEIKLNGMLVATLHGN